MRALLGVAAVRGVWILTVSSRLSVVLRILRVIVSIGRAIRAGSGGSRAAIRALSAIARVRVTTAAATAAVVVAAAVIVAASSVAAVATVAAAVAAAVAVLAWRTAPELFVLLTDVFDQVLAEFFGLFYHGQIRAAVEEDMLVTRGIRIAGEGDVRNVEKHFIVTLLVSVSFNVS